MGYYKIECSNGLCGCDDYYLLELGEDPTAADILETYVYTSGYAGQENDIEDGESYDDYMERYEQDILEYSCWVEITEEEFIRLRDEESWEVR